LKKREEVLIMKRKKRDISKCIRWTKGKRGKRGTVGYRFWPIEQNQKWSKMGRVIGWGKRETDN